MISTVHRRLRRLLGSVTSGTSAAHGTALASVATTVAVSVGLVGLAGLAGPAAAQPSPLPTGGPPTGEDAPKPEGVAEAAPKASGLLATTPTLPPPRDRRKKFEVVTIDGYLRTRGDWLKNLHLGFDDTPDEGSFVETGSYGGAPFPRPLGCNSTVAGSPCEDSFKSSNLRLRLEPSIQLSETIAVHTQLDLFDNVVLGDQVAAGSDLVLKRAWAEIATGLGHLKFGRMPDHFGLGIVSNSGRRRNTDYATWETLWQPSTLANVGGTNPLDYDLDSDHGDTVDRLSFTAMIPGTPFRAIAAVDWPAVSATSDDVAARVGQPWDIDNNDDAKGWMLAVARFDTPTEFDDRVARGKLGLNFGARVVRRTQDRDYDRSAAADAPLTDRYIARGFKEYQPNVWLKVGWRKFLIEAEAAMHVGSVENLTDLGESFTGTVDILSWGGVVRASARAFDDKLGYGLEVGAASGDESDATLQGNTHVSQIPEISGLDRTINRFAFDPDYEIDLILFRELLGGVSNAVYFRPWMSYQLTRSITFRAQNVTAAALRPVATPGNSEMWGIELDGDLGYSSNGFHAGIAYGLFLPLGAMNHPSGDDAGGNGFGYGAGNTGDAGNAHTVQARFAIEF